MTNVTDLPRDKPPELLSGPFECYHVLVQGRVVPRLTGRQHKNGTVSLTVDGRFGATFSGEADAAQAAFLIAQASAVSAGYVHFAADTKDHPFAPISMGITNGPASAVVTPLHPEG